MVVAANRNTVLVVVEAQVLIQVVDIVVGIVAQAAVRLILQEVEKNHGVTVMQVIVVAAVLQQEAAVTAEVDLHIKAEVHHTKKDLKVLNK